VTDGTALLDDNRYLMTVGKGQRIGAEPMDLIVYEGILVGAFVLTIVLVAYLV
jgi:hypothetical protein